MNAGAMNPFSDPIMEAVFANKDVAGLAAQSLINAVLSEAGDPFIGEIVQLTPQKVASNPLGRGYRFDIEARARHEVADIEIQFRIIKMNERGMLYAVSILKDSAERGASLESVIEAMPRVIVINMLHFNLRPGHGDFCQPVDLAYRKPTADGSQERASDRMAIYNIEIKKFEKQVMPSLEKMPYSAETPALHYWLLALCKSQREKAPIEEVVAMSEALTEFARRDAGFSQYAERYEKISSDENVRRMYNIWTEGMSALDQARAEGIAVFKGKFEEAQGQAEELKGQLEEAQGQAEEFKGQAEEFKGQAEEFKGQAEEFKGQAEEFKGQAEEFKGQLEEAHVKLEESQRTLKATARKLIALGLPTEQISEIVELPLEKIRELALEVGGSGA